MIAKLKAWLTNHTGFIKMSGFLILALVFRIFAPSFLTLDSIGSILVVVFKLGLIAIGIILLMISGEIDLSVDSVMCV